MLVSLGIRDVVLVDRLELQFQPGLSALTGETGAGKSILLDALGLALGARGDAGLVRRSAAQATVTAEFDVGPNHPARTSLAEQGLDANGTLVLRRILGADGRSRASINDQAVSIGLLRSIGRTLVEVHGQFDQHGLLDPDTHRDVLDAFGGLGPSATVVGVAHGAWRAAEQALAEATQRQARAAAESEQLGHWLAELDQLKPQPGEEAALAERRVRLQQASRLAQALETVQAELGGDRGVETRVAGALRSLGRLPAEAAKLTEPVAAALERAAAELAEAGERLAGLMRDAGDEPNALERLEDRLFALRAAARKHGVAVDALPELHQRMAASLAELTDGSGQLARLGAAAQEARAAYAAAAARLTAARIAAAAALDRAILAELPPLKLDKARFRTLVEALGEAGWSAHGADRVAFEIATNPGSAPGPLARIASGGELSRIMLALKVVLARISPVPTLVFDEVDSGIGGAVAAAVGDRLARLGDSLQVLVVTHSPQVAARARHQLRVVKSGKDGATVTTVEPLGARERREEIARMLSGALVTEEARAAADRLLAS